MNIVVLREVLTQTPAEYAAAPLAIYKSLLEQAEQLQALAKAVREFVEQANEIRYGELARQTRQAEGRDFGVIRIADQDETIICDLKKIVDWDQAQLSDLAKKITAAGEDPAQYLDVSLKVPESKYNAWPHALREQFAPARTVRPGKASYRLASGKECV